MSTPLFLRALQGEVTETKPVWLMRQAGRYLPEYREVRKRFTNFLDFVADAEASATVTVQPINRFGLDAAILFSDILVTLPPMGIDLKFISGMGPVVERPIQSEASIKALTNFDCEKALPFTKLAIEKTKRKLPSATPLLGFVGGPLTLASYAIEGKSSKDLQETKKLFYREPFAYEALLTHIANITGEYLALQAKWGCDALVIMDSWAGHLSIADYRQMALPYTQIVLDKVRQVTDAPVLHYANGAGHLLNEIEKLNFSALGLDWRTDLMTTLQTHPTAIFQGNLDPALLFAPAETIQTRTCEILDLVKGRPHIMNLGHGVLPQTPIEGVQAFIDAVRGHFL